MPTSSATSFSEMPLNPRSLISFAAARVISPIRSSGVLRTLFCFTMPPSLAHRVNKPRKHLLADSDTSRLSQASSVSAEFRGFTEMVHGHDVSESIGRNPAGRTPQREPSTGRALRKRIQSAVSMPSVRPPSTGLSRPAACAFLAAEIISLMRLSWFASLAPGS